MGLKTKIKELSKLVCNTCEVNSYDVCSDCPIHKLVNEILEMLS